MNFFRSSQEKFKIFRRNLYEDILRTIFCKRFIRLRRYALALYFLPYVYWSIAYEAPEYKKIYTNKLRAKNVTAIEIQKERGLDVEFTEEELAHLHNYIRKNRNK